MGGVTDLIAVLEQLKQCRWVDLTHTFAPGIPHYSGFPDESRTTLYDFAPKEGTMGSGFLAHEYRHVGQWGTHMDPPSHFDPEGRSMDEVPVTDCILPLVVLQAEEHANDDPNYAVDQRLIDDHEQQNGEIPPNAFVAVSSGWSRKWPDHDGPDHPGWSVEALTHLVTQRSVTAIGHDFTDTDPGSEVAKGHVPAEDYILRADRWQFELMANLHELPPTGSLIVATWPKPLKGSGFPARAFAIVP